MTYDKSRPNAESRSDIWIDEVESQLTEARGALNRALDTARRRRKALAGGQGYAKAVQQMVDAADSAARHAEKGTNPSQWWEDRLLYVPPEHREFTIGIWADALRRVLAVANHTLKAAPPSRSPLKRVK